MMNLDMIMSTNLVTILPTDSLATARKLMHDNKIHHLPVCVDKELVGLVTLSNVLAATDSILRDADSRLHAKDIMVEEMMVKDIATVTPRRWQHVAATFDNGAVVVYLNGKAITSGTGEPIPGA